MIDWLPLWLSVKLALATTIILLVIGIPLSYWLAYTKQRWKVIVEACVSLPMVLPPSERAMLEANFSCANQYSDSVTL